MLSYSVTIRNYEIFPCQTAAGVECAVVALTLVPVQAGDRVKTDRRARETAKQDQLRARHRFPQGTPAGSESNAEASPRPATRITASSVVNPIAGVLGSAPMITKGGIEAITRRSSMQRNTFASPP
jgi:hypothetical protein